MDFKRGIFTPNPTGLAYSSSALEHVCWKGFSNDRSAPPQVPEMKRPVMCNWCVRHCAEPLGPRVNITWQCEKRQRKGSFDSLFIPILSLIRRVGLDHGMMIFPEESETLHYIVTTQAWRGRTVCTWGWVGERTLNTRGYKSIFLWKQRSRWRTWPPLLLLLNCFTYCTWHILQ